MLRYIPYCLVLTFACLTSLLGNQQRDLERIKNHFQKGNTENWTWVFYGDSITQGASHTGGWRAFPEIFAERVRFELGRVQDTVINSGNSGQSSANLINPAQYDWQVKRFKPNVVIVMVGMNDIVRDISPNAFASNLEVLVDRIRKDGGIPVLQTSNTTQKPRDTSTPYLKGYQKRYEELPVYMEQVRKVAKKKDVILVDNFDWWSRNASDPKVLNEWLGETIHPGHQGHLQIAGLLLNELGIFDPASKSFRLLQKPQTNSRAPEKEDKGPQIAVTIDFLDYVFYDREGGDAYYPLEVYEKRIQELVQSGTTKLYLRVNVCGLTLYPSEVAGIYGDEFGTHKYYIDYGPQRLINTLEKYNPLTETIRLGHKYGLEVWAWESLFDDAADIAQTSDGSYGGYPLMDPWFRDRMHFYAMQAPWKQLQADDVKRINESVKGRTIGKIVILSEQGTAPLRMTKDHIRIYTSSDNITYTPWTGDFTFTSQRNGNRNSITLGRLAITAPFVQIKTTGFPSDNGYSMVWRSQRGVSKVYDTRGDEIPAVWGFNTDTRLTEPLLMRGDAAAWDYSHRSIGFGLGEPVTIGTEKPYYLGMAEFLIPEVMEHKLDRFKELLPYGFDGFMFNLRTHSSVTDPDDYGFNPEVRQKFLERYGKDIWKQGTYDMTDLFKLRAEAIDTFYAECKRLADGRPLYVSILPKMSKGERFGIWSDRLGSLVEHIGVQRNWDNVDGVMMLATYFPEQLDMSVLQEKTIGSFIELVRMPPASVKVRMEQALANPVIGEIELYEALNITDNPALMQILRELLVTGKDGK